MEPGLVVKLADVIAWKLPLILAWAVTIHKSQGRVKVDLSRNFATGEVFQV